MLLLANAGPQRTRRLTTLHGAGAETSRGSRRVPRGLPPERQNTSAGLCPCFEQNEHALCLSAQGTRGGRTALNLVARQPCPVYLRREESNSHATRTPPQCKKI